MADLLDDKSLTNFIKDFYKRWHKDQINELVVYDSKRFIELMTTRCWEQHRLLKINDRL